MRRIIWLVLTVISMVVFPTFLYAGIVAPARVRLMDGDVLFRTPETSEWLPVSINTPIDEGDSVWCPPGSRSEIQLADGTVVRLDGDTQLDILANEENFTHLHLSRGKLYLRTAQGMIKDSLQIDADNTTVVPAARTRLRIDMMTNSQEDVSIFKGSAYLEGNGSRTNVRAGEHIAMEEGHQAIFPLNPPDSWEEWNKAQDLVQSRSAKSSTALPDELKSYAHELDTNGRWQHVQEYGMVWRPTVIHSDDWAPYRSGRWVWKNDDYVWISYESWGWAPYHFGRWAFVSSFGWCWVPPVRGDIYWGPGYVGWHRAGSEIGWTPLAPGEIFYGRRYYGTHSVNISTTHVTQTNITYRNKHHRGGLTIVGQNDFLRGRIVATSPARNSSVSVSVSIGSPRIQPLRETRMPIVKQTPPRISLPRAEQPDHREMRNRFPRVITNTEHTKRPQPAAVMPSQKIEPDYRRKTVIHPVDSSERPARNEIQEQRRQEHRQPVIQQQKTPAVREERRQGIANPAPHGGAAAGRGDASRRDQQQRDGKQKRVWKVTTTDQSDDNAREEKGRKEQKEHKEQKERKGR